MIAIFYITLGILYTIACILDGPDVKPIWKRHLGKRLERMANNLNPINYCTPYDCELLAKARKPILPKRSLPVTETRFDCKRIEHSIMLDEGEMFRLHQIQQMDKSHGVPEWQIPRQETIEGRLDSLKLNCMDAILDAAKQFVNIQVINDQCNMRYVIKGVLMVGKPRNNN